MKAKAVDVFFKLGWGASSPESVYFSALIGLNSNGWDNHQKGLRALEMLAKHGCYQGNFEYSVTCYDKQIISGAQLSLAYYYLQEGKLDKSYHYLECVLSALSRSSSLKCLAELRSMICDLLGNPELKERFITSEELKSVRKNGCLLNVFLTELGLRNLSDKVNTIKETKSKEVKSSGWSFLSPFSWITPEKSQVEKDFKQT